MSIPLSLSREIEEAAAHGTITNHVDPQLMTENERYRFRWALKGVGTFLRIMDNRYHRNLTSC